jgi:Putative lumazine-binding
MADDREAIEHVLGLYLDGASQGDVAKLREAFHPDARMFGSLGGQRVDVPIEAFFSMAEERPLKTDDSFSGRIVSVDEAGDAAAAVVEEDGCWGTVSFRDYFNLTRIDGSWKIVNKTFAHTGGDPPGA